MSGITISSGKKLKGGLRTILAMMNSRRMTCAAVLAGVLSLASPAFSQAEKIFVFGNSLINHASDTEKTTVPYWLGELATSQGREFALDGQFGFLRNFARELPPKSQWGFSNVSPAWTRRFRTFDAVGYDTILFNPTNFIQYQGAERPYDGDNTTGESPLSVTVDLLREVAADKRVVLYEGWADMAPFLWDFPPGNRRLRKYHAFNTDAFHDWHSDYAAAIRAELPELDMTLLPVARILSRAFLETGLKDIPVLDLYSDDAPHGTPSLYFLAAVPTYVALFGEYPVADDVPSDVHPLIKTHFADFMTIVREEVPEQVTKSNAIQKQSKPKDVAAIKPQPELPALGYGLNGIADWSTQVPFVDLMKTSRTWVGHLQGQFGGWGIKELQEGRYLDENGWPVQIPPELSKIETYMLTDFPEDAVQHTGVYRLTYEGEGQLDLVGRPRALRYQENEIWFQFSPGDGLLGIAISETDPNENGNHIRNISVVREDQIPLFEAGVTFNPDWLRVLDDARLVRFMDWMFTNGSMIQSWEERPQVSDFSYTRRGVPLEIMVDLVNHIGADPWFNMPHLADDTYVRRFSEYVHDHLRTGLVAHMEYSNEMWNFQFEQTHWAVEQAKTRWNDNPEGDAWMQIYGVRAAEMAAIWSQTFAADMSRLKRVISTHTDWPGLEQGALHAALAVEDGSRPPVEMFDAYAVTGYFGHGIGAEDHAAEVLDWIAKSEADGLGYQGAIDRVVQHLKTGSLKELTTTTWPYHAGVAKQNDLELIMYEGGTHVVGTGEWTSNDTLTAFFQALNYSPEMAEIYELLLSEWRNVGGTVFNAFVDVAKPSQWGSWGTLRFLGDDNPRADILRKYNATGQSWPAATRESQDFDAGLRIIGGPSADILAGSKYDDFLLGGNGDDEFYANGGKDFIHGGAGDDHVILDGALEEYRFATEGTRLVAISKHGKVRLFAVETLSFSKSPELVLATSDLF